MANPDLYNLIEANSTLAREKKELIRLIKIMAKTIKEMTNVTELYSQGIVVESGKYRAMPKGFLTALNHNHSMVEKMTHQSRISIKNVEETMKEISGGFDDDLAAEAYYQSLVDELSHNENNKNKLDPKFWLKGHKDKKTGKWFFAAENEQTKEFYEKHRGDIENFLNNYIIDIFKNNPKIDPKKYGDGIDELLDDGMEEE